MKRSHARHDAILRAAIESQGGYVFQVIGDAFCSAFHSAESALQAAIEAQSALQAEDWGDAPIRVRMGIHTGRAEPKDDGQYNGYTTLARVQRVMSAAHGNQTLLSSTAGQLLRGASLPGASLRDLGKHRLKDLLEAERLFQLILPGLPEDFPPLRTLEEFPNNLPLQLTSFIGRDKELADVKRLMGDARLLTLTGPGGTGKSRLSLQAATELLHTFPDGVWLVELAPISDPSAVPGALLAALDLPPEVHRPAIDMLCDHLRAKESLIILDNCEHLVEACARMVDRLLHATPGLHILASSREGLGIAGEVSYRVPSLGLPDPDHMPVLESLNQYEAVRLFIERARASHPDFQVNNDNAPAVAQICHRLDGIPLAIELAAAKVRVLSAEQIARRLDDRFRLLTGGSRTALERHQTLQAALDWSYNFLPTPEQALFRRLSIFVNGWTLEAAEAVCAGEGVTGTEVFGLLEQLVNKSLVAAETWKNETRYRMLETMRQYGREKSVEAGEGEMLRDQHLAHYLDLAETAAPHLIRAEQIGWLDRLEAEHDNLRAALEWSLGRERPGSALRLTAALGSFWDIHCHWLEGARWLERALAMPFEEPTAEEKATRARALYQDAQIASDLDNLDRMHDSASASLSLSLNGTNPLDLGIAQYQLGSAYHRKGENDAAGTLLEQSLASFRTLDDHYWEGRSMTFLADIRYLKGHRTDWEELERRMEMARKVGERRSIGEIMLIYAGLALQNSHLEEADIHLEEAEDLYHQVGFKMPLSNGFGIIAHARKDYARARKLYIDAIAASDLLGEKYAKSFIIMNFAILARDEGNFSEAEELARKGVIMVREVGTFASEISRRLAYLGQIHYLQGNLEEAKTQFRESLLNGKSDEFPYAKAVVLILLCNSLVSPSPHLAAQFLSVSFASLVKQDEGTDPFTRGDYDEALARARANLSEEEFQAAWKEGESLSIAEAWDLATKALED